MRFSVKGYKRILCLMLAAVMIAGVLPCGAAAEDMEISADGEVEISEYCNLQYEECASGSSGKLFVHRKSGRFFYEDSVGQRWYSNPDMADMDSGAGGVYRMELQSLLMIQYYEIESKQYKKANTETSCVRSGGSATVTDIKNGFEVLYDFAVLGFKIPVKIVLDENGFSASIDCTKIVESKPEKTRLYCVSLLPYFGAGAPDERGYIMVADGSGSVMNFNNGAYSKLGYSSHIYGRDISKYLVAKPAAAYNITMPVFGIKKENSAITGIITDGAAQCTVWCYPNRSITSYANVYTAFDLRETDIVVLSEDSNAVSQSTLYQKGDISLKKIAVSYRSTVGEDADYNGMAKVYKDYLVERDSLKVGAHNMGKVALDFYGSVKKKKSLIGFPVTVNATISKIDDIKKVTDDLSKDGVENLSVTLREWSREQLAGKIDYSMKPVSAIGSKGDVKSLLSAVKENGGTLNLAVNITSFSKSGKGYNMWTSTAKSLSNAPIYDYKYYVSNSYKNKSAGRTSYLKPSVIEKVTNQLVKKTDIYDGVNLSVGDTSTRLYSDFNKKAICNLEQTKEYVLGAAKTLKSFAADNPADYMIKYTTLAQRIPYESTGNDIFDYDIPFVQLVLSGITPYTGEPVNLSANMKSAVLESAANGSCLQFDLITEKAYSIVGTSFDNLYNAEANVLYDDIVKYSKHFAKLNTLLSDGVMAQYQRDGDVSYTRYSNGTVITVDRADAKVTGVSADGKEYSFKF